ncbi:melanoma-associated antigen B4 [Ictidomys tridecemlineatus]|nr:melanoma-associated antigen B2-like [Ictidomys tridecemlineatus]XP_005329233.1 melanoma-associated antigen B2-like [Ictidomys tridecemlineatus]KAG3271863.1 melanoma-associated antigen B2-like [Ictidomys tridecemlineatus]KAG3271864.1 melanoma-associated antigen B2-like [Ictidomys tridecemlineatus]
MPRGQKSKLRSRAKRQQARDETQGLRGAQATAEEEVGSPCSSPLDEGALPSSPAAGISQVSQRAPPSSSLGAGDSCKSSEAGAQERMPGSSQAAASPESSRRDPLTRKASLLVQYLLEKYKTKEPITQADMLKVVNKKYKEYFPEILRRTSERVELVFGLELKEVDPNSHSYVLISKLGLSSEGSLSGSRGLPKTGLLMTLLGVIFMKGNRATEAEIWEFLNVLGIYAGRRHLIFGEPRKLITKDLVQEKYLEYRQVPGSDPPSFEFLWGPRAHAETSKMKVLEVLAKINDTNPNAFPNLYEEALKDEEEKAGEKAVGRVGAPTRPRAVSKVLPHRPSHI